ncbi:UBP1-associated protein 2B [Capsicum annuum]|uniref:UBP1-associated protein 2B n=1 Tax=Capsicum annuum TaxID=4072 RepID=UPI0007BEEAE9|nr:UBP1-associated protein 2B [Capsicum annuum]
MAAKNEAKKRKIIKKSENSVATTSKITKNHPKNQQKTPKSVNPTRPDSGSDSDSDPLPLKIQKLLEPYTKEQLVSLAVDTALSHPSFYNLVQSTADKDVTHRKIFVYGLARETTRQTLVSVFEEYGEVEECNVVVDHATGKGKGYAFVVFKTRRSAVKALRQPRMMIDNRLASCKLASLKESKDKESVGVVSGSNEFGNRKIYVSNVPKDIDSERLRMFFAKFGEIEVGPMGFDSSTGKSKGYALFVYRTVEEAKRCLEEPCKMFEGRQLYCKKAAEGKVGGGAASITTEIVQQPLLAMPSGQGVYGPQSMGVLGQNTNVAMMNSFYGGVLANPYGVYTNPFVGVGSYGQQIPGGMGIAAGYGGLLDSLGGGVSGLGAYGGVGSSTSTSGSAGGVATGLMQLYPNKQVGQSSAAKLPGSSGYSSHL